MRLTIVTINIKPLWNFENALYGSTNIWVVWVVWEEEVELENYVGEARGDR